MTSPPQRTSEFAQFSSDISKLNAKPLWERTMRMGPGSPAKPAIWRYADMRPQLLRSAKLISTHQAERRVLMLENPGLPGTTYITNSLYCGLQVILPGEVALAHRHSPNALRFIIEGQGVWMTVNGERLQVHPGDFVLTPGWCWHDHGHGGTEPAIWLDALDNPFGQFFGAIFREDYPDESHPVTQAAGINEATYASNLAPVEIKGNRLHTPLLAYPYNRTREALHRLAKDGPMHASHGVRMRYINPLNGGYVYPTFAVFIQWLPRSFAGQTYRSTDGTVFHVVEGGGHAIIGDTKFSFTEHDIFVAPPWTPYRLNADSDCVLFSYSDRAAQETLGFWREESPAST
jgi:gentisate 1,2-dioxygenase